MAGWRSLIVLQLMGLAGLASIALIASTGRAASLTPGHRLVVSFTVPPFAIGPFCSLCTPDVLPDVLAIVLGSVQFLGVSGEVHFRLYNGASLLDDRVSVYGLNTVGVGGLASVFRDPSSIYIGEGGGLVRDIDFSSIRERTIDGRLEVTVAEGELQFDFDSSGLLPQLRLARGVSPDGIPYQWDRYSEVWAATAAVIVPEPSMIWALTSSLLLLVVSRRPFE